MVMGFACCGDFVSFRSFRPFRFGRFARFVSVDLYTSPRAHVFPNSAREIKIISTLSLLVRCIAFIEVFTDTKQSP